MKKLLIFCLILLISSCVSSSKFKRKLDLKLENLDFNQLAGWLDDNQEKAIISFRNSCAKFAHMPDDQSIGGNIGPILVKDFANVCKMARDEKLNDPKQARNFFENWFMVFAVKDQNQDQGLFTGYYVPELKGSRTKNKIYQYPIYAKPQDLNKKPYFTRKQIEQGALKNKKLELAYVSDKVDLFFMQIQGSGRVILEDGSILKLSFAGKNNRSYSSVGKYIIDHNLIKGGVKGADKSYFAIKHWLKNNPTEGERVMNINQSYVFFQTANNDKIIGSQGVALTPYRSLAVDTSILPLGLPIWLDTNTSNGDFQKLLIAQDSGGAIKGAIRGDIFFGRGESAENFASKMNFRGKYYILLPKEAAKKIKAN